MRTGILFASFGAAMFALVGVSHAGPLAASGATNAAIAQAFADKGVTQTRHRKRWWHYGWYRGHHYGWYKRHHRHTYGYYPYHRRSGISIYVR